MRDNTPKWFIAWFVFCAAMSIGMTFFIIWFAIKLLRVLESL